MAHQQSQTLVLALMAFFGSTATVFTILAVKWSRDFDEVSQYSMHTDGLRFSVILSVLVAVMLYFSTLLAGIEYIRRGK